MKINRYNIDVQNVYQTIYVLLIIRESLRLLSGKDRGDGLIANE